MGNVFGMSKALMSDQMRYPQMCGLLIREIPEITFFFVSDSVPPKKKNNKNPLKTTTYTQPKSPNLSAALVVFGQSVPFRPRVAPSCPETAAGWPRSCTFFSTSKNLSQKSWGRPWKKQIFFPTKNSQQKEKQMGSVMFFGHRIDFFCF